MPLTPEQESPQGAQTDGHKLDFSLPQFFLRPANPHKTSTAGAAALGADAVVCAAENLPTPKSAPIRQLPSLDRSETSDGDSDSAGDGDGNYSHGDGDADGRANADADADAHDDDEEDEEEEEEEDGDDGDDDDQWQEEEEQEEEEEEAADDDNGDQPSS